MQGQSRRRVLTSDGAWLNVVAEGADLADAEATLVLAHGWTLTHHSWDPVVPLLLARHPRLRVVRWDHRDHGRSTSGRDGRPASVARLGADLARVLAAEAATGPLVLGGHSMGGMSVMAWAGLHPERFAARVTGSLLVSTAAGQLADVHRRRRSAVLSRGLSRVPPSWRLPRLTPAQSRRQAWGPDVPDEVILASARREGWVRARSLGHWYPAMMLHDETTALAVLASRPLRILVGEFDRITPVRYTDDLAAALPDAVVERVAGAGHMLLAEHPDLVADHLTALITPPP
jgi:pimeloyl-ACP methyl ester carboxylesterase